MISSSVPRCCVVGSTGKSGGLIPSFGARLEMRGSKELSLGRGKCRDGARGTENRQAEVGRGGWRPWSILVVRMQMSSAAVVQWSWSWRSPVEVGGERTAVPVSPAKP